MTWIRAMLVASPFVVAAVLNVLVGVADRFHFSLQRVAGYCFLFGTPWAWLLDRGWFGSVEGRQAQVLITYAVVLWIPALLYSSCLWILLRVLRLSPAPRLP